MLLCPEEDALLSLAKGDSDGAIQGHVEACGACRQRLRELEREIEGLQDVAKTRDMSSPPADNLPAIGKYLVIGRLGSGGQAEVYRALDPTLGREVAIKWGRKGQPVAEEGRELCQLKHENLVAVFELDLQDDRPFLAMEYIRGSNLEQLIRDQPFSARASAARAARLLLPIARALAEVHRRGLVHLDIKPHNILIDREGKPYLTDFGLARRYDDRGVAADRPLGGTPGYMAPEQAAGLAHRIGPRTDIFGLGAVLFRLLTGQPPVPGTEPLRVLQETAAGKLDLSPLRAAKVPRQLKAICQRALAVEPEQRYADADAFANDLKHFLRRGMLRAALAGTGGALLAAAGLGYLLWPAPPIPEGPHYLIDKVIRGNDLHPDLLSALPLRNGDKFKIRCPVPKGYRVAIFWFDAAGKLDELDKPQQLAAGRFDKVIHPPNGSHVVRGPPGTDLALLIAGPGQPPSFAELEALLKPEGPLPALPPNLQGYLIYVDRDEVNSAGGRRDLQLAEPNALDLLQERLQKLRLQLRDRWPFLAGVAVQQRE